MASKTFVQLRADGAYDLRLEMSSVANTSGNYSDITYNLYVRSISADAAYNYGNGNRVHLAINGTVILDTANIGRVTFTGANQTHQFAYGTTRVYHNADGSKSVAVRAIFQQTQALHNANYDINDTFVLDNIPRSSTPTANVTSATLGATSITITTNRASSSFTHTLTMKIGNTTVKTATGVGASYTWTPEESLAKYFTASPNASMTITCTTYNGSTNVGQKAGPSITLNIPSTMVPSCAISVAEAATLPSGITGYIKTKSMLKITVTASGVQGSTINASTGYSITANGTTYKSATATTDVLVKAGTNTITTTVTDSRGKTKTASTTITVIDYNNPTISDISAYRCTSSTDSTPLDTGEYICVDFTGVITSLSEQNVKSCFVWYKTTDSTSWGSEIPIELADYNFSHQYIFAASTDTGYNVCVRAKDSFTHNDYYQDVSTGFTLINIPASGRGLGIGKVSTTDNLVDSAWDMAVQSEAAVQKNMSVGNANGKVGVRVAGDGSKGLVDTDKGQWIVYSDKNGDVYLNGLASLASGLSLSPAGAYHTDANGNFVHNSADTSNYWNIRNNANVAKFKVYFENGDVDTVGDIKQNGASIVPIYGGSETNGYIKFPNKKIMICWQRKELTNMTCTKAWGSMYESGGKTFNNFAATFSAIPACIRFVHGSNYGCFLQPYGATTTSNPGNFYVCRPDSNSTATTLYAIAIAIGTYS